MNLLKILILQERHRKHEPIHSMQFHPKLHQERNKSQMFDGKTKVNQRLPWYPGSSQRMPISISNETVELFCCFRICTKDNLLS